MRRKRGLVLISLAGAILFLGLFALCAGAVRIPPGELLAVLTGETLNPKFESVLWHLRIPRVLLGLMAGASLSVAGAIWGIR